MKDPLKQFTKEFLMDEIKRLRGVLHEISDSRPDWDMDIEREPILTNWIRDTCYKAKVGVYPGNKQS